MPIRDRFRRVLRKSESSGSISQTDSNTTTTVTTARTSQSSEPSTAAAPVLSSSPPPNRLGLVKTFTLGRDADKQRKKEEKRQRKREEQLERERRRNPRRRMHPSEKPLTEQNLRHQEMLSHFTMTFGASDQAMITRLSFQEGVSPCCTRAPSIVDGDFLSAHSSRDEVRLAQHLQAVAL